MERTGGDVTWVHIAGDVDLVGESELTNTVRQLSSLDAGRVGVDLAGITFAGASLLNFLARVSILVNGEESLIFHEPTPAVRRLIKLASLDTVGAFRDGLLM